MNALRNMFVLFVAAVLAAGCATDGNWKFKQSRGSCAFVGGVAGAGAGAIQDRDAALVGAVVGAGIGALFCGDKDTDGDGVKDKKDRCPNTPPGAVVDEHGCQFDDDHDGVPNGSDACPGTPAGAAVDERGCELDSDGDGVVNSKDRCPNTPAGVKVDANGCELDSDGDGVVDSQDECPDTPKGIPVDNNGCELAPARELKGVNFEFDSARLTPDSEAVLQDGLKILKRNPDLKIEIAGHTDSTGPAKYNLKLSLRRAQAVRDYMVAHGANRDSLTVRGYGETQPVADNSTKAGRAANRRVEFRH